MRERGEEIVGDDSIGNYLQLAKKFKYWRWSRSLANEAYFAWFFFEGEEGKRFPETDGKQVRSEGDQSPSRQGTVSAFGLGVHAAGT